MSEANLQPHSQLDSKSLTSRHYQTCSSLGSAYQALYTEFLDKSRHNNIPSSPVARATLRALIDQTRRDLKTCSERPIRIQISRVLKLQESLLASIRTLPSDILIIIFRLVIETSTYPGITYSTRKFRRLSGCIFLFTWICFWWRHEAISYPTFWSRIKVAHITYAYWGKLPTTEVTAFLNECILRSGVSVPMSITISLERRPSPTVVTVITTMLVAQAHRWRQAALSFLVLQQIDSVFPFKPSSTRFPLLEDLSFRSDDRSVHNPILECRPPLQKLEISELSESYADVIASRNLKVLKVRCYRGVSLARLLHVCPCLEFLSLRSFRFTEDRDANQITCQSSLLSLSVGGDITYGGMENGAWNCVTLPKLTKLSVMLSSFHELRQWDAYEPESTLNELNEVVKRSGCTLQRVNLLAIDDDSSSRSKSVLEVVENFFQGLPVEAERCFVEDVPLQEWKAEILGSESYSE
ncbi:hypothetical protein BDP27DRAFT_1431982 [Rhodocollybia butyracea]|uniref:F-box domain-containing protein n=1 Tax=Rhodocollybia butyracea TaxID=206335 RepID=A0A9P5P9E2_9AGAR|nr:hypothetical protein BDP27DRAFT_1431982 [Rhodocollybia butyracea]